MKKLLFSAVCYFSLFCPSAQADFFKAIRGTDNTLIMSEAQKLENIDIKDKDGWTPLMYAARIGNLELATFLIEKGADLEAQNHAEMTPYLWAAYAGHLEILKLLEKKGANTFKQNSFLESAMDIAAAMDQKEIVQYLLNNASSEDEKQEMAQNAIYLTQDKDIQKLFEEAGATPISPKDLQEEAEPTVQEPTDEEIKAFINQFAPELSLSQAINKNDTQTALQLINQMETINPNIRTTNGWNFLMMTTMHDNVEIAKALIQKGIDINDNQSEFQTTALILALSHKKKNVALELLKTPNIDVTYQDQKGRNAVLLIQESQDKDLLKALNNIFNKDENQTAETIANTPVEVAPAVAEEAPKPVQTQNKATDKPQTADVQSNKTAETMVKEPSPYTYH